MTNETVVLDPAEFIEDRVELGLDELGINIREAEWGDAEHELFLVKQEIGEIPAERHAPNRTATFKLRVDPTATMPLANAAQLLQKKVGLLQQQGGWVKRIFDDDGGFSVAVGAIVHTATIGGLYGWMFAHRSRAEEVTLTLTISPYFYGVEEIEGESVELEPFAHRYAKWKIDKAKGTAPGLLRLEVAEQAGVDLRGILASVSDINFSSDVKASEVFQCGELTPLGTSVLSSPKIITGEIGPSWRAVALTDLNVGEPEPGPMTHIGARRVFLTVGSNAVVNTELEFQLAWRSGDGDWEYNDPVKPAFHPHIGPAFLDLGEIIPQVPQFGGRQWQGKIFIKNNGTSKEEIALEDFFVLDTKYLTRLSTSPTVATPSLYLVEDTQFGKGLAEGVALNGYSSPIGGKWKTEGEATDFKEKSLTVEGGTKVASIIRQPGLVGQANPRKAFLETVKPTDVVLQTCMFMGVAGKFGESGGFFPPVGLNGAGALVARNGTVMLKNEIYYTAEEAAAGGNLIMEYLSLEGTGVVNPVKVFYNALAKPGFPVLTLMVTGTLAVAWLDFVGDFRTSPVIPSGPPVMVTTVAPGAAGQIGLYDWNNAVTTTENQGIRYYMNYHAWEPSSQPLVYGNRGFQISSFGHYRQAKGADVWGQVVGNGMLPQLNPAGLEDREVSGLVIPSQGDFKTFPDFLFATNEIKVTPFYRPAYHFTSEAGI